jgi:hypothetical protein
MSTVTANAGEGALKFPAASVSVAVKLWIASNNVQVV